MNVVATRTSQYPEFEQRRKEAIGGRFLDEAQIKKLNLNTVTDYVNVLPGFRAVHERWGGTRFLSIRDPDCQPVVLVNDLPIAEPHRPADADDARCARGVHHHGAGAPPSHRSACGTIIFWTKR